MTFDNLVAFFKDWSGRHDLEDETIVAYLNEGQMFLDSMVDHHQSMSRYIYSGVTGQSYLSLIAQAKVINRINLVLAGEVSEVYEIPLHDLQVISETLPAYQDPALPSFFALAAQRKVSTGTLRVDDKTKLAIIETGTTADKLGILFNCPLDKDYTIDIFGKFYSATIGEGTDPDTFWATQRPFTLLHSALYKLEIAYRNTEGAKDWLAAIQTELSLIDKNAAEQSANNITEMRG